MRMATVAENPFLKQVMVFGSPAAALSLNVLPATTGEVVGARVQVCTFLQWKQFADIPPALARGPVEEKTKLIGQLAAQGKLVNALEVLLQFNLNGKELTIVSAACWSDLYFGATHVFALGSVKGVFARCLSVTHRQLEMPATKAPASPAPAKQVA